MAERSSDGVLEYRSIGVLKERLVQRPTTPTPHVSLFTASPKVTFFLVWPTSVP